MVTIKGEYDIYMHELGILGEIPRLTKINLYKKTTLYWYTSGSFVLRMKSGVYNLDKKGHNNGLTQKWKNLWWEEYYLLLELPTLLNGNGMVIQSLSSRVTHQNVD